MITWSNRRLLAATLAAALLLGACRVGNPVVEGTPPSSPAVSPSATRAPALLAHWDRRLDAPTERLEAAGAAVGGRVYVAGGLLDRGATDAVEVYHPATDRWSRAPDLPEPLHHASAVEFRGRLVVLGGFRAGAGTFSEASDAVYALGCPRFNTCEGRGPWVRLPSLRRPRGAAAAGVAGDRIVVAGGRERGRLIEPTEVFDGRRWRDRAPIPTPRDHLAGASDGRYLYAVGGRRLTIDSVLDAAERYDPRRDRWARLPDLPTARGGFGAAVAAGLLVTAGGEGSDRPSGTFDEVEAYDIGAGRWLVLEDLPVAVHAAAVAAVGEAVYLSGGGPRAGGTVSARTYVLDLSP